MAMHMDTDEVVTLCGKDILVSVSRSSPTGTPCHNVRRSLAFPDGELTSSARSITPKKLFDGTRTTNPATRSRTSDHLKV